jgi:hypothetical protein
METCGAFCFDYVLGGLVKTECIIVFIIENFN